MALYQHSCGYVQEFDQPPCPSTPCPLGRGCRVDGPLGWRPWHLGLPTLPRTSPFDPAWSASHGS